MNLSIFKYKINDIKDLRETENKINNFLGFVEFIDQSIISDGRNIIIHIWHK